MELTEAANNESVTTSRRRLYTLHSVSQSETDQQSGGIEQFKEQIHKKYVRSVANKIYSFPLILNDDCSFFSDSDTDGLEDVREYDLNSQNKKQRTVQWEQPVSKQKIFRKKNAADIKSAEQKRIIKEKSLETKRKYADLLRLIDKKPTVQPTLATSIQLVNKSRQSLKKQPTSNHFKSKQELPQAPPAPVTHEFKTKPLNNKINRLRTEPDESLVSTHRVNGIIKFRQPNR